VNSITSAIEETFTSGSFDSALHYYAQVNDAAGLSNATLSQTSVVNLAVQNSTKKPTNIGAIVGGILGFILLISLMAAVYLHTKRNKTINQVVDTTTSNPDAENRPSVLAHRISVATTNPIKTNFQISILY